MQNHINRLSLSLSLTALLAACATTPSGGRTLQGIAGQGNAKAEITVFDAAGQKKTLVSNEQGAFQLGLEGLKAPLMLVANLAGKQYVAVKAGDEGTIANINALTDRIASDIALEAKFKGPVGLVASGKAPAVSAETIAQKTAALRASLDNALKEARVDNAAQFDPVSTPLSQGVQSILASIKHNRGYHSSSGERGETSLYDSNYREISRLAPLRLAESQAEAKAIAAPGVTRIFIAGDSTASNYDPEVAPRMGWGQVFDRQIKAGSPVKVVNVAQSGRSSRSFITEGWFGMIEADLRQGDYLLVQFGHNDEKCGNEPPAPPPSRDLIDTANLCTYPGSNPAIPAEMSFRKTLERYIAIARKAGATPVLITPVTRRSFKDGKIAATTHTYGKGKFPGDYSQTIRETAQANGVALVDLDAKSMEFFNAKGEQGSLDYYLAVDPARYPYYATNTGSRSKPDNTHFQEKGAEAVAGLIAAGLKQAGVALSNELK